MYKTKLILLITCYILIQTIPINSNKSYSDENHLHKTIPNKNHSHQNHAHKKQSGPKNNLIYNKKTRRIDWEKSRLALDLSIKDAKKLNELEKKYRDKDKIDEKYYCVTIKRNKFFTKKRLSNFIFFGFFYVFVMQRVCFIKSFVSSKSL